MESGLMENAISLITKAITNYQKDKQESARLLRKAVEVLNNAIAGMEKNQSPRIKL